MYFVGDQVEGIEEALRDCVKRVPQVRHFETGAFFTGPIDAVRIYNRTVTR